MRATPAVRALTLAALLAPSLAAAQSFPLAQTGLFRGQSWPLNYVPTPDENRAAWQAKADTARLDGEIARALAAEAVVTSGMAAQGSALQAEIARAIAMEATKASAVNGTLTTPTITGGTAPGLVLDASIIGGRTAVSRSAELSTPRDWGAKCDGVADDSMALATGADALAGTGSRIRIPGNCRIRLGGARQVWLRGVSLVGDGLRDYGPVYGQQGGTIIIDTTAISPFAVSQNWGFEGLTFYWPQQQPQPSPIAYPALIVPHSSVDYVQGWFFDRNQVTNAFDMMDFRSAGNLGHGRITNNVIFALRYAIAMAKANGELWIRGNDFTPAPFQSVALGAGMGNMMEFYSSTSEALRIENNGIYSTVSTNSVDGTSFVDNVLFAGRYGIHIVGGFANILHVVANRFDVVLQAMAVDGGGAAFESFLNGNYINGQRINHPEAAAPAVSIGGTGSQVSFTGNNWTGTAGPAIGVSDSGNVRINVSGGAMSNINNTTSATPLPAVVFSAPMGVLSMTGVNLAYTQGVSGPNAAVQIAAAKGASLTGNTFSGWKAAVQADGAANATSFSGNTFINPAGGAISTVTGVMSPQVLQIGNYTSLDGGLVSTTGGAINMFSVQADGHSAINLVSNTAGMPGNLVVANAAGPLLYAIPSGTGAQVAAPQLVSAGAGSPVQLVPAGAAANIGLTLASKGTGATTVQGIPLCANAVAGSLCSASGSGSAVSVK